MIINGMCDVEIVSEPEELRAAGVDKPFLRLKNLRDVNDQPVTVELTLNLAHMIGGVAAGAAERFGLPW